MKTKTLRRVLLVLAWVAISLSAVAQEKLPPLPKDLPAYGPLVPFKTPNVEVKKLGNGLTIWLVPRPGFPKVALAVAVRGGRASDPQNRPGLSDLLVAALDQGTKTRSAKQIAEAFEAAGGDLGGDLRADAIVTSTQVMAARANDALEVLADVMQNATFPDDEVALAKRNALENLKAEEAQPSFLASRAMAKALFGNQPYATLAPTQDSINAATAAELRAAYAERFRPDQALVVAVGDFSSDALEAAIAKDFGGWAAPSQAPVAAIAPPAQNNPHSIFLVPRPGSVQTTLTLAAFGPKRGDPDYAATQVANAIYGGMFGSRLIRNIREDKGYTYSPGAGLQLRAAAGVLQTRADVRNAVTGPSLNEIEYELNRMATTDPTSDELNRAQRYLVGTNAIILQIQAAVAQQLGWLWVYGLPPEALGQESANVQKVTLQDVAAAGRKYFAAARQTIVTVGEEKTVREQLAPFGLPIEAAP
ncbi:MAG TPA: pitrilysin family protein [Terriglobia bacterium]|nr:pitrilysin family protein [Terriglobia bacterium]